MDSVNQKGNMYKKFISCMLVAALLNLFGCYSSELVNVTDYKQIEEEEKVDNIRVITKDSEEYKFTESNFHIESDTLYGKVPLGVTGKLYDENIALSDIESIHYYNFDAGVGLIIIGIVAILWYEATTWTFNWGGK
jgi:hypothetical protein